MSAAVVPPDHPVTLALPRRTGAVIDGLTQAALDAADVAVGLPSFGEVATQTAFGPSCIRLQASGLVRWPGGARRSTASPRGSRWPSLKHGHALAA